MTSVSRVHTPATLLDALKKRDSIIPSQDELFEQRVSFVYGSMGSDSGVTREQIRKKLKEEPGLARDTV